MKRNFFSLLRRSLGAAVLLLGTPFLAPKIAQAVDARVLPKGTTRLSFTYAKSDGITQQYNDLGVAEDITKPYNLNLDSAAIGTFAASVSPEFGNLISLLNDTGLRYDASLSGAASIVSNDPSKPLLGDALTKGFLGVEVEAVQRQSVIQFMHGITDQLSVGFMIPIVTNKVRASAEISKVNNTIQDYTTAFEGMGAGFESVVSGLQYLDAANIDFLQREVLEASGYQRFGSSEQSGVGDVNFGGRFNYLKTKKEHLINSFQLGFTAPTGKTRQASALTQLDTGAGVWDIATSHILNYTPGGMRTPWMLSHSLNYTYRLPGKKIMRVRDNPNDILPTAEDEEEVRLHYATKLWTTLGAKYSFNPMFSVESNYEWYWKGRDDYRGTSAKDYDYLGDKTEKYLETLNFAFNVSLIDRFMNKKFPMPIDFAVNYFRPIRGRNAPIAPFATAELAMYF